MTAIGIRDVAALAGVAVGTASEALNHQRGSSVTVARVTNAARSLGYVPSAAARQLKVGRSFTIGLAVSGRGRPFPLDAMSGVEDAAHTAGYAVLFGISRDSVDREARYLDLFERHRVDGVLYSPQHLDPAVLDPFRSRGVPVVLIGAAAVDGGLPAVGVDERAAGRLAVEHLLAGGCRRILHLAAPTDGVTDAERRDGALSAASDADAGFTSLTLRGTGIDDARALLERMTGSDRADGVVCTNPEQARWAMELLRGEGIRVPADAAVICFDGSTEAGVGGGSRMSESLSMIVIPNYRLGARAMEILVAQLDGVAVREERIESFLVSGSSTRNAS